MYIEDTLDPRTDKVFLNIWDTGGHPIFQDLLPCFARLMCIFGIVFRLNDIENFDICPKIRPYDVSQKWETSPFTNREILYRNLAYIKVFSSGMQDNVDQVKSNDNSPRIRVPAAIVIGTFKDQLPSRYLLEKLNEDICACSNKFPIYPVSPGNSKFICEVDNTISGMLSQDEGINYLKENLARCAKSCSVKSGHNWKRFKADLQKLCYHDDAYFMVGVMPLSKVIEVGKACNVKSPHAALKYYHDLGIFMWYDLSKRKSLHGFVVIEPKILLAVFTKVFCFKSEYLTPSQETLLDIGILSSEFLNNILKKKASKISNQFFIAFLEEHYLASKVYYGDNNNGYFLPSLLGINLDYKDRIANDSHSISPLYIVPQSGYIATGLFTRLLTALSRVTYGSTVWKIPLASVKITEVIKVCRNQFIFEVSSTSKNIVYIVLSEYSRYIKVDCLCNSNIDIDEDDIFFCIASTLKVQLEKIIPLRNEEEFDLTFRCENYDCCSDVHFFANKNILFELIKEVQCSYNNKSFLSSFDIKWCGNKQVQHNGKYHLLAFMMHNNYQVHVCIQDVIL